MQFLSGILSLMLGVMRQLILAERSHFCEAMASQQCSDNSQGLLEALKSGNQRQLIKECDALQASHTMYHLFRKLYSPTTRHLETGKIQKFNAANVSETNMYTER